MQKYPSSSSKALMYLRPGRSKGDTSYTPRSERPSLQRMKGLADNKSGWRRAALTGIASGLRKCEVVNRDQLDYLGNPVVPQLLSELQKLGKIQ